MTREVPKKMQESKLELYLPIELMAPSNANGSKTVLPRIRFCTISLQATKALDASGDEDSTKDIWPESTCW